MCICISPRARQSHHAEALARFKAACPLRRSGVATNPLWGFKWEETGDLRGFTLALGGLGAAARRAMGLPPTGLPWRPTTSGGRGGNATTLAASGVASGTGAALGCGCGGRAGDDDRFQLPLAEALACDGACGFPADRSAREGRWAAAWVYLAQASVQASAEASARAAAAVGLDDDDDDDDEEEEEEEEEEAGGVFPVYCAPAPCDGGLAALHEASRSLRAAMTALTRTNRRRELKRGEAPLDARRQAWTAG